MLRITRVIFALITFILITILFLDFTGILDTKLAWLAKIQFLPAVLALNMGMLIILIILTLIFGRVYCSVLCPLGIFQDTISWINGRQKKKRLHFSYSPALSILRYGTLFLFVIALIVGLGSVSALLDPYAIYGRIAQNMFSPFWLWGNNLMVKISNQNIFSEKDIWIKSLPVFVITILSFIIIIALAWRNGRTYCNTICPVGTILGFLSRYSLFRIAIDPLKCKKCSSCARACKTSCINYKEYKVDNSRCVSCMNCLEKCNHGAIKYKLHYIRKGRSLDEKESDKSINKYRRQLLSVTPLIATIPLLKAHDKIEKGISIITNKKRVKNKIPLVPAGGESLDNVAKHCTACQLCVSACPNHILQPSDSLETLMQPKISYERGYCNPECTKCAEVCPTGAIKKITKEEKSYIQIGYAVFVEQNCIVLSENKSCDQCAQHCPMGAIIMLDSKAKTSYSPKIPYVNTERCIGCGNCENLCPTQPYKAIYVEGYQTHLII